MRHLNRYPSLREGIDFHNTSLIGLFPNIQSEQRLADLFQISGVSATIEDLRRILNNPNSILELNPSQIRTELLIFESHTPDELVPLKRLIRNKLSYWEAVCRNRSQINVEEFTDANPSTEVIAEICVDVNRAIFADQKTETPLVRVMQADLRVSVVRDTIRIPGKKPISFVESLSADLWVGIQVADPSWRYILARASQRTFAPLNPAPDGNQVLFSTPINAAPPAGIRTGQDTIAISLLTQKRVDEEIALGTRPYFTHLKIANVSRFSKEALDNGGLLTISSYMATLAEGDVNFKGWGVLHVASPDNLHRLLVQDKIANTLASSAYLGFRGAPLPSSCAIRPF